MKNIKIAHDIILICLILLSLQSCIIKDATAEDCVTKEITVAKITEGSSFDIQLFDGKGDYYYINRGLENGHSLKDLSKAILNKKVTLHVYKFKFGIESEHVSQLAVEDSIIFTEFK